MNLMMRIVIFGIVAISWVVECYNVETDRLVVDLTSGEKESLFGYTVALLQKANPDSVEVLVGSPSATHNGQKSGTVYSCNIDTKNCKPLRSTLNETAGQEHEFLGVSMAAVDNEVMMGASRWFDSQKEYLGRVTVMNDNKIQIEDSPCDKYPSSFVGFGYCMAGFSTAATTKKNDKKQKVFVTGTPGALKFSGALITLYNNKFHLALVRERLESNSLMGYSTAVGTFSDPKENGYIADIAGGAPKAGNLYGKVTVYKISELYKPSELATIEGPQDMVGSYFGASVAAVDLDNDGKDDLLVGSPYYAKIQDEGRVYVYMNRPGANFNGFDQKLILEGDSEQGARFGSSISNIGDINSDGYNDIAIGAPWGGPDGNGVVYIYNGGQSGLRSDKPQKIFASDMPSLGKGFGISIVGGVDVDGNLYPDLAIGAFKNDHVYVMKTRPVIRISSSLYTNVDAVPNRLHRDFKCPSTYLSLKMLNNCVNLILRLKYEGKSVPDVLDVKYTIEIDVSKLKKRAMTLEGFSQLNNQIQLKKGVEENILLPIAVQTMGEFDWISPIEFISRYDALVDTSVCVNTPCPMLDQGNVLFDKHQMVYSRFCASVESCSPDLKVKAELKIPKRQTSDKLLYGRDERISFLVDVVNSGEAAYQSQMKITFHSDLQVIGVEINQSPSLWEMKVVDAKSKQLFFFLENPIFPGKMIEVEAKFSLPTGQRPTSNSYTFQAQASSFGDDLTPSDNMATKAIDVSMETCIGAISEVRPSQIQYELDAPVPPSPSPPGTPFNQSVTTKEIGTQVKFTFIVRNNGNLPVDNLKAGIMVPVKDNDVNMVYVTNIEIDGIVCSSDFNEMNYTYEKDTLESEEVLKTTNIVAAENRRRRNKRNIVSDNKAPICSNMKDCKTYYCTINRIEPNRQSVITMVTRLWDHHLPKINPQNVRVALNVEFADSEHDYYEQRTNGCSLESTVSLKLQRGIEREKAIPIPWWIILLSIIGALIILGILIAVLFKCGFFNRDRKRKEEAIDGPSEKSQLKDLDDEDD